MILIQSGYRNCSIWKQKLRRAVAIWGNHRYSVCGIDRQPGGEQAYGQETTDALESEGRPLPAAGPYSRSKWWISRHIPEMVPKLYSKRWGAKVGCVASLVFFTLVVKKPWSDRGIFYAYDHDYVCLYYSVIEVSQLLFKAKKGS